MVDKGRLSFSQRGSQWWPPPLGSDVTQKRTDAERMSVGGKLGTYITGAQNMEAIIVSAIPSPTSNGVGEDFSYKAV